MDHERFQPGFEGEIWYEHWHRYHFAAPFAAGKRVLDVACGEGYGAALLATLAREVTAVDAATEVVVQARRRYGHLANVRYVEGQCESLPCADASIDLVVSFETLEHIPDPERLLDEAARVLDKGGLLLVSTPNREIYSDRRGYRNPHHVRELYRDEFVALLKARFAGVALFGQRVDAYSAIWPLDAKPGPAQLIQASAPDAARPGEGVADAMYFLALCGEAAAVSAGASRLSLLSDRDHEVSTRHDESLRAVDEMRAQLERAEAAYLAGQRQLAALSAEHERALARLAQLEAQPAGWRRR
jgi:ubiquinone/menaquinone biosynthesis C-methylase UbiE